MRHKPSRTDRKAAERRGRRAEWIAALYLMLKGYRILARRYKTPMGEVDLIARRGRVIAMVEVKARNSVDEAVLAVHPQNRKRIIQASHYWLSRHQTMPDLDIRFDIVAITPGQFPTHLMAAYDESGF
ncbi:YraN family protein [Coralliovum pocilloporae]|uniref:YraN family protein n=1 Tax=Coralliovum pocilloporae TaxID=3066369 RepID=UPI0033070E28